MLKPVKEGEEISLVNADGSKKFPLTEKVWELLSNPDILMDDFKRVIQSYTIETNRDWAMILKEECTADTDYRNLRSAIRTIGL